jgi:alpha-glucosidase
LSLRGTPFLYAGEELGLADAEVPGDRVVDQGGRDGCRAPMPWTDGPGHGWPAVPWLPWPPEAGARSVERQQGDPASMLEHYRRLLRLRRATPALSSGRLELLDAADGVVRWRRLADGDGPDVEVAVNFTDEEAPGPHGPWLGGTAVEDPGTGGRLGPDEARICAVMS